MKDQTQKNQSAFLEQFRLATETFKAANQNVQHASDVELKTGFAKQQ